MPIEPYQQRVVDEKTDLSDKIDKLDAFIGSGRFTAVPSAEQTRLARQHLIMLLYEQVLSERISAF